MKLEKLCRYSLFLISSSIQLAVLVGLGFNRDLLRISDQWFSDVTVLFVVSVVLTVFIYVLADRYLIFLVISKTLVVNLILLALNRGSVLSYFLFSSIFLDVGFIFSLPVSVYLSLGILVINSLFYGFYPFLGIYLGRYRIIHLVIFSVLSLGFGITGIIIKLLLVSLGNERRYMETLNSAVIQLTHANTGFLKYASDVKQKTTIEERKRITRELHDIVGQTFTNIISMMDAVIRRPIDNVNELKKLHQWIRDHAQSGLQRTRFVLYQLRSLGSYEITGVKAIYNLIETFRKATQVRVNVEWGNIPWEFSHEINIAVYYIIQEAMINALRHGKATEINIYFWENDGILHIVIQDNGRGSVQAKKGIGQQGMEERVANLGGGISFENTQLGYKVLVWIPTRKNRVVNR